MPESYRGVIIEESLEDNSVLRELRILKTEIEKVTDYHKTPWLRQWTKHTVEIPPDEGELVAVHLSKSISSKHKWSWYADFKNDRLHYIIFRDRVFRVDRRSKEQYDEANKYGEALGIPSYQLDFYPEIRFVVDKREE